MNRAVHEAVSRGNRGVRRRLAFALLAAPLMWSLHELASLVVVDGTCERASETTQRLLLAAISVAAAAVAGGGLACGYGVFRHRRGGEGLFAAEGWDAVQFLALFAVFVSGLLLLNILYFSVVPFLVEPCLRST